MPATCASPASVLLTVQATAPSPCPCPPAPFYLLLSGSIRHHGAVYCPKEISNHLESIPTPSDARAAFDEKGPPGSATQAHKAHGRDRENTIRTRPAARHSITPPPHLSRHPSFAVSAPCYRPRPPGHAAATIALLRPPVPRGRLRPHQNREARRPAVRFRPPNRPEAARPARPGPDPPGSWPGGPEPFPIRPRLPPAVSNWLRMLPSPPGAPESPRPAPSRAGEGPHWSLRALPPVPSSRLDLAEAAPAFLPFPASRIDGRIFLL